MKFLLISLATLFASSAFAGTGPAPTVESFIYSKQAQTLTVLDVSSECVQSFSNGSMTFACSESPVLVPAKFGGIAPVSGTKFSVSVVVGPNLVHFTSCSIYPNNWFGEAVFNISCK